MDAMILSAGRGERMRPLTDLMPKPLLSAGGKRLIEYHLFELRQAGFTNVVVNTAYKGNHIVDALGDGSKYDVKINYSHEGTRKLGTGGGIKNALDLIASDPFVIVNADIWSDFNFQNLPKSLSRSMHLILVNNPGHNDKGDFGLDGSIVKPLPNSENNLSLTYAGISVMSKKPFAEFHRESFELRPLLDQEIKSQRVTATHYSGKWFDIGTPSRLEQLDRHLKK